MSLRDLVQTRLVEDVVRTVKPANGDEWKVLVVDKAAKEVLGASARMYDLMSEGIMLVEPLEIGRQPLKHMEAIYLMAPTKKGIKKLCEDFTGVEEDPTPMYKAAHVFFLRPVSEELMDIVQGCQVLVDHLQTLTELNLDFLAVEERFFSVNRPDALARVFSPDSSSDAMKAELHEIADRLATVCATLNEYPIIRFMETDADSECAKLLGVFVKKRLDALRKGSPDYESAAKSSSHPRGTLLIVDRSFDVMTPLIHEFTYQAMIHDVLAPKLKGNEYTFASRNNKGEVGEKKATLDETDVLWPMLRHMHIADSMNWIVESFNDFLKKNKAVKFAKKSKVQTLSEMTDAMRQMPQFQELLEKYTLHINLSSDCMKQFNKGLDQVASLEQDMSTGADANGKPVKTLITRMHDLLSSESGGDDPHLTDDDKVRLLMLYIISQEGIKDEDRKRLIKRAGLGPDDTRCISNLKFLGVTLKRPQRSLKKLTFKLQGKRVLKDNAPDYELSRYSPKLKSIMEDAMSGALKAKDAPYLDSDEEGDDSLRESKAEAVVSLRKPKTPGWAAKKRGSAAPRDSKRESASGEATGSRLIVFVIGGVTCSETRSAYTVADSLNRDVIVGSTDLLSPPTYIQTLRNLQRPDMEEEPSNGKAERLP
jgi:syntaxin-binding protein 1